MPRPTRLRAARAGAERETFRLPTRRSTELGVYLLKPLCLFVQETGCVFVKSFVETGCVFVKPFVFICAGNWVDWTGLEMPTIDFSLHCLKIPTVPIYFSLQ